MKNIILLVISVFVVGNTFANLTQGNWRWRNNNGSETTATWKAPENSTIAINDTSALRLRMEIINTNTDPKDFSQPLQYATNINGPWEQVNKVSAAFTVGYSSFVTQNQATTKQLTGYSANLFVPGQLIVTNPLFLQTLGATTKTENEWVIKPTPYIKPGTTYYFKVSGMDYPVVLPSLTTSASLPVQPDILTNGGFESELKDWKTSIGNGAATFGTTTNPYHTGNKAIKVVVTNKGGKNKIKLKHKQFTIDTAGTYELRFWALADIKDALLNINVKTATSANGCTYKISNRFDNTANGWQMYHYTFKVGQSPLTLEINFNTNTTYYLDDVEILAATHPVTDVATQYKWQYQQQGYGWLSGDNDNSVLLPDGSVAWIFSDSFLGTPDAHSNIINNNSIVNNLIVHEQNGQFSSIYGGTSAAPVSLFSPGNGNIFWNSGGVVDGGKLKILLMEIGGSGSYQNKTYIGTLTLPDLQVESLVESPYHEINAPNTIFQDSGFNYIYLSERVSTFENYTQLVRVAAGKLNNSRPWQFYKNDGTWSTGYTNVKRILSGVEAASVKKLGAGNYVMSGVPNLTNEVAVWFAPAPEGPWTNKQVVANIPQEEGVLPYQGHIDAGSGANGVYTLSYSVYPFTGSVPQQLSDKGSYIPYYIKANLLALSPFTNNSMAGTAVQPSVANSIANHSVQAFIAPNPVQGNIRFTLRGFKGAGITARLTNMAGTIIYTQQLAVTDNGSYALACAKPAAGLYILQLIAPQFRQNLKVIVE